MKTKSEKIEHFNALASPRDYWRNKNRFYYKELGKLLSFLIPEQCSVIEIGCGTGDTLAQLRPLHGKGIDFCPEMVRIARRKNPHLEFIVDDAENLKINEQFDYVICSDLIGELTDVWKAFREIRKVCNKDTRLIITYYNYLWEPILQMAESLGLKIQQDYQNWLS